MICNASAIPTENLERGSLGWRTRAGEARVKWVIEGGWRGATETGEPRYDGKVGSAVTGRLRVPASQATALRCGGSGAETTIRGSHVDGIAPMREMRRRRRRRGRWRRRAARSHYSQHIFPCFLLLPRDKVKGERGRRAGWAQSASQRVAVVGAHLRRPCSALPALPSLPIDA